MAVSLNLAEFRVAEFRGRDIFRTGVRPTRTHSTKLWESTGAINILSRIIVYIQIIPKVLAALFNRASKLANTTGDWVIRAISDAAASWTAS